MPTICVTPPAMPSDLIWPDISSLVTPITDIYSIPANFRPNISLPAMPTMPKIGDQLPTMSMPSLEGVMLGAGIQAGQIFILVDLLIGTLTDYIDAIPLPTMPGLPLTLADLLSFDPAALLAKIRAAGFDFTGIPNLPTLWPTVTAPDISSLQALQFSAAGMMEMLTGSLMELVGKFLAFLDDLELSYPAIPVLPTIPTIAELQAMMPKFGMPSIPGFPAFSFPSPLRPDGTFPDFELTVRIQSLYQEMSMFSIKTISDYIESLPIIGDAIAGTFPTVGDLIGPFSVGEICYNT